VDAEQFGSIRGKPVGPVTSFDGTQLHVEELGAGPTVILSHGFCLNLTSWHYQMRDLASEFRLVLYDHRGHGRSGRPESDDWSMGTFARDLEAVIDAAGGNGPVTLVGHSLGGMVLLEYCAAFPEEIGSRITALVFVDTSSCDVIGGMLPVAARAARPALRLIEEAAVRAAGANPQAFDRIRKARADLVSLMVRLMGFGPKAPPDELAFVGALLSGTPPDVLVYVLQTLRFMDCTAGLEHIDIPTLVVCGSRDRLTPPAASSAIANSIHTAELAVIRGAGHMPMLEKPDQFNRLLRAFLAHPGAALSGRRIGGR
jgi:pimeloyl-ACP methyl ester carboxylesterase